MHILNSSGHIDVVWTLEDLESRAAAEAEFGRLQDQGYVAFEREHGDEDALGKRLGAFDARVEEIFWIRPLVGG